MLPDSPHGELQRLLTGLTEEMLGAEELAALAAILRTDPTARAFYHEYMETHSLLQWHHASPLPGPALDPSDCAASGCPSSCAGELEAVLLGASRESGAAPVELATASQQHNPLPGLSLLGNMAHGTFGYFASGWPMAYLVATMVLGFGLLVGSIMQVSQPVQVANPILPSPFGRGAGGEGSGSGNSSLPSFVGRITGMIDCQWSDPNTAVPGPVAVPLGRKYALSSGLLEISYDTGAQVILQGPCTYEVESPAGGFLSVGRLTAKVEKKATSLPSPARGGHRRAALVGAGGEMVRSTEYGVRSGKHEEQSASRSSFLIPHSYFAVRTPTAIVTDLGTEFGVEVSEQGNTTSYVFRGKVAVQVTACDGKQGQALQLSENESACVEKTGADESLTLRRVAADPAAFVRHEQLATVAEESRLKLLRRWQAYNRQVDHDPALLAHYTFEPSKENTFVLSNRAAAGDALDGRIEGAEWVMGRFPGKFALRFLGPGSGGKVVLPEQERFAFAGPFSVAVWFKAEPFTAWWQAVITKGDVSWRLQRSTTTDKISFDTDFEPAGKDNHDVLTAQPDVADGQWHFAVAVYEPKGDAGRKRLYIDGRLEAETETPAPLRQNTDPVWIGAHCVHSGREFQGLIDEVAIFMRALSAEEVATMFKSGNVLGTGDVCP